MVVSTLWPVERSEHVSSDVQAGKPTIGGVRAESGLRGQLGLCYSNFSVTEINGGLVNCRLSFRGSRVGA
jgi:hypothetical protein